MVWQVVQLMISICSDFVWKFESFSSVAQDMSMPLVFGWYPPNMTSSFMPPSSFPYQDLSQMPIPVNIRRELMLGASSVQWIEGDTERGNQNASSSPSDAEGSDSESFFDCDTNQSVNVTTTDKPDADKEKTNLKTNVQVVSKTVLQEFDGNNVKLRPKADSPEKSVTSSEAQKRNSMSAINKASASHAQSSRSRVKKSLSNSDLKVTKAPILSTSSFRRVFSPFSPKPVSSKSKRGGSRDSSTASLNIDKDGSK
jgi:hypothetical protein